MEWKQERPDWCPHLDCVFVQRFQDALCGRLPHPEPHGPGFNDSRFCMRQQPEGGEVIDWQINEGDVCHFRRMFDALYPPLRTS